MGSEEYILVLSPYVILQFKFSSLYDRNLGIHLRTMSPTKNGGHVQQIQLVACGHCEV
jgi:hypothetical protein